MTKEKQEATPRTVKNLAELKRLIQPGTELRITAHSNFPDTVGLVRVVTKVQTNGFYSVIKDQPDHRWSRFNGGKGGVSYYEKAKDYIFDGDTVTVLNARKNDGSVLFQFQVLEPQLAMTEELTEEALEKQDSCETMVIGGMSL